MDERVNTVATLANISNYAAKPTPDFIDGAPHIKHRSLRLLYGNLVVQVYDFARQYARSPLVLDLGAGEGSVTLPFLELGARVTAVDVYSSQLELLRCKCGQFGAKLETRCEDVHETLSDRSLRFDIIVANSFLHHVPDYIGMIRAAVELLAPHGQFFSFQDPLRYDSAGKFTMLFSNVAYFSWRVFKGDVLGGARRRLRRARGIYLADSVHDNAEYHVTRNGVDQGAISTFFKTQGFICTIIPY